VERLSQNPEGVPLQSDDKQTAKAIESADEHYSADSVDAVKFLAKKETTRFGLSRTPDNDTRRSAYYFPLS